MSVSRSGRFFGFMFGGLLLAGGCDSSEASKPTTPSTQPLYALATTVTTDDVDVGYLVPIDGALGATPTFNLDNALEIGDSTIGAWPGQPFVYVGSSDEPTITRFELQADGRLHPGKSLNLANLGVSRATVGSDLFYAEDKAYLPDDDNRQLVVWNPKTMAITGTIPLRTEDSGTLVPWTSVTMRATDVLVSVSWQEDFSSDWSKFGDHVDLITIDPKTDTIVDRRSDTRSSYAFWGSSSPGGTAYYSPLSYYAPIRAMLGDDRGFASVALRARPGEHAFDPDYTVDLSALVGGRPAGNLFPISESVALIRAWHSDLVPPVQPDKSNWQDVLNEAGFLFWRWEFGAAQAVLIPDQVPGASEVTGLYHVDGRSLMPRVNADYTETRLEELTSDGRFQPVLTGPGNVWGIVRVR